MGLVLSRDLEQEGQVVNNMISQILEEFRGDSIGQIASALGENPAKTQSALGGVLQALFGGLAERASSTDGASKLVDLIRRNRFDSDQTVDLSRALSSHDGLTSMMAMGKPLLDAVFGSRTGAVTDWVSTLSGVNRSSASSLMSLAAPMVFGLLGRKLSATGGGANHLMELLAGQKGYLQDAPAGLLGALGLSDRAKERSYTSYDNERRPTSAATTYQRESRPGLAWWKWAVPLLAGLALILFLTSRRPADQTTRARISETANTGSLPSLNLGAFVPRSLPGGVTLNIPANGIESRLVAFIEDRNRQVDRDTWFSFDRLEFETGSAQLKSTSQEQLSNIAEILKSYPQVKLKIGGYTDSSGDDAANLKLSSDRAQNTRKALVALGISPDRLEAEGYGEQHPVATNDTEEGRQRNRRIDLRVTQK
jgi:OmpA-OmpF porin, OOP family